MTIKFCQLIRKTKTPNFFKVAIRTTMAEAVGRDRGELKRCISEIEEDLDDTHKLKLKACGVVDVLDKENK